MPEPESPPYAPSAPSEAPQTQVSVPGLPEIGDSVEGGALAFFKPEAVPFVLALLIGTTLLVRLSQRLADRTAERVVEHRLAIKQGMTLVGFASYGVAFVIAASSLFDLSAQALLAVSGTLAVAGGFLLRDVAEATMAGISILLTRPFQVGDRISFGGYYGEVREIGLRTVRLVTLDDNLVSIPSNKFLQEPVASANAGALDCMVVVPFYLATHADHARARQIVHDAILSSRFLYLGKPVSVLVSMRLADEVGAVIELTAKAYVYDARHERTFASDITDRVLRSLRQNGIPLCGTPAAA